MKMRYYNWYYKNKTDHKTICKQLYANKLDNSENEKSET